MLKTEPEKKEIRSRRFCIDIYWCIEKMQFYLRNRQIFIYYVNM